MKRNWSRHAGPRCPSGAIADLDFHCSCDEAGPRQAEANAFAMAFARLIIVAFASVLLIPQVADAREPGPTWRSETRGLPASTLQGHWTESGDGRSVELVFAGGHLVEAGTTFRASWLTPFTTAGKRARFEHEYELENHNELGRDIVLTESFRFREKGGRWWPWITMRDTLKAGVTYMGGGSMFGGGSKRPVQFEWRLTGSIEAPTYLRGSASFSIN